MYYNVVFLVQTRMEGSIMGGVVHPSSQLLLSKEGGFGGGPRVGGGGFGLIVRCLGERGAQRRSLVLFRY